MNKTQLQAYVDKQIGKHIRNIVVHLQSADKSVDLIAAAGIANPHEQSPIMPDTPYFIASISKTYTATIIMKLYEEARLDLDAPIADYLPESIWRGIHVYKGRDYSQHLKLYQLVSQTSGLPDYFEDKPRGGRSLYEDIKAGAPDRAYTLDDVLARVRTLTPRFEPDAKGGMKAHYADTNYHLLGVIIEAVTGQSYADNLAKYITMPLGLRHTYAFDASQAQNKPRPATLYFKDRILDVPLFLSSHVPEGGIVATASENMRFLRAFFAGELFDKKQFERMTRQWNRIFFPLQYGYGMMRFKLPRLLSPFQPTPEFIGHSGSSGSFAFYSPERQLYLVGTVNQTSAPGKPFQMMVQLANQAK